MWLTVLPSSQDGTDLSSEHSRYALWWLLDIPLKYPSLNVMAAVTHLKWSMISVAR